MAKKQTPQQQTLARIKRTEAYAEKVRRLFAYTVNQICEMNKRMPDINNGIMYSFDGDSKKVQQEVETLLRQLHAVTTAAIKQGIELEWEQANEECDKLVQSCFGREVLKDPMFDAYTSHNERAMNAFIARSERGLNLSDRVWKSVRQLRDEMEVAITVSVGEGASAQQMSRRVREYLDDPDLMFRRFRYKAGVKQITDENGKVIGEVPVYGRKWKKRIKKEDGSYGWIDYDRDSYRTGAGVYKSSAKNAMRVARTETNIAYRRSDNERWSQMDFVLGQRIQLSREHPKKDICDKLQGDYPVEFVFEGWHPQCFCFVTPILMDADEMRKARQARLRGEKYTPRAKRITDYPQAFKDWCADNAETIAAAHDYGQDPYFVRHNYDIVQRILNPDAEPTLLDKQTEQIDKLQQYLQDGYLPKETAVTIDKLRSLAEAGDDAAAEEFERRASLLQTAAERHAARTPEKIADIKQRWQERNEFNAASAQAEQLAALAQGTHIDTSALTQAVQQRDTAQIKLLAAQVKQKLEHIKLAASNVSKLAADYGEVNATALDDLLSADEFDYASVHQATRKLAQNILAQKQAEQALTDLIPDAHKWHQQFSMSDLQAVHQAVQTKLAAWSSLPLETQKKKLEFEINFVADPGKYKAGAVQYPTWKVAQSAYMKRLQEVETEIQIKDVTIEFNALSSFAHSTKSQQFKDNYVKLKAAIVAKDVLTAKLLLADLKAKKAQLEAAAARRASKKAAASLTTTPNTKLGEPLTDAQFIELANELVQKRLSEATSVKMTAKYLEISIELKKSRVDVALVRSKLALLGENLDDAYSKSRKDVAMWAQDPMDADKRLRGVCGAVWRAASRDEKEAIHGYTQSYHNIQEPLRGLTYYGSASQKAQGLRRIPHCESIIRKSTYDFDMWVQRGDGMIALKKFGLLNYSTATDAEIYALVGRVGNEGGFWSAGVAKGKGFSGSIIFNIYIPRGTQAMYCEPFSYFGHGGGKSWDGVSPQSSIGYEAEILLQRGTKYRVTKVTKSGSQWYIDVEVIEQNPAPFPYVGGYPYPY